jgi:hypothetical protein
VWQVDVSPTHVDLRLNIEVAKRYVHLLFVLYTTGTSQRIFNTIANINGIPLSLQLKQPEFEHLSSILRNSKNFLSDTLKNVGRIDRLGYVSVLYFSETVGRTKQTVTTTNQLYPFVKVEIAQRNRRGEDVTHVEYMQVSLSNH